MDVDSRDAARTARSTIASICCSWQWTPPGDSSPSTCSAAPLRRPRRPRRRARVAREVAGRDGVVDAGEVLVDDAARADVQVADLGIAHLAVGQADMQSDASIRVCGEPASSRFQLGIRRARWRCTARFAAAAAVEDQQHEGTHARLRRRALRGGLRVVAERGYRCRGGWPGARRRRRRRDRLSFYRLKHNCANPARGITPNVIHRQQLDARCWSSSCPARCCCGRYCRAACRNGQGSRHAARDAADQPAERGAARRARTRRNPRPGICPTPSTSRCPSWAVAAASWPSSSRGPSSCTASGASAPRRRFDAGKARASRTSISLTGGISAWKDAGLPVEK